jgi:hypothetical protein
VTDARCEALIRRGGEDRPCGQTVALTRWTDHTGKPHAACSRHAGGLKRRHPAELPERTAPSGTLGLGTPWTRGRFAPADVIAVENAIPQGYRINVIAQSPYRFVVVGLREVQSEQCPSCPHSRSRHTIFGMCDGNGTECYCVRFPDSEEPGDPNVTVVELFRTPVTSDPLPVALAMCERLALL